MFYFDPSYFLYVLIPTVLISFGVQAYLKSTFAKWSAVRNSLGLTGVEVGQELVARTSLQPVRLERSPGALSDHFDPRTNAIGLSDEVASQPSIAAMAVTAHELGHAEQHQTRSPLMGMRNALLPALQFSPTISYLAIMLGLLFNLSGLLWIGILFFGLMVLFSILTLPIELDASRRGLAMLQQASLIQSDAELAGARSVLRAAAMTYLAAAITSLLQLFYYIGIARRSD